MNKSEHNYSDGRKSGHRSPRKAPVPRGGTASKGAYSSEPDLSRINPLHSAADIQASRARTSQDRRQRPYADAARSADFASHARGDVHKSASRAGGRGAAQGRAKNSAGEAQSQSNAQAPVRILENLSLSADALAALELLPKVLDEVLPLSQKHKHALKAEIRALWEALTSDRESRNEEYLGTPPALSAYVRYFLPWNIYRLASIFSNADFCLPDNAVIADIGSGPLTAVIALYAARAELRTVPLHFYCVDRVERSMEIGRTIFESLAVKLEGRLPPWSIDIKKESFGAPLPEKAHLFIAANLFNEFFWKDKRLLSERALITARSILSSLRETGSILIMEPGDPRSASIIASLRAAFITEGATPLGPCPHAFSCPMPGLFRSLVPPGEDKQRPQLRDTTPSRSTLQPVLMPKKRDKYPWCHFGIDATKAPRWLQKLSDDAGLPKEKTVFSWLWAARHSRSGILERSSSVSTQGLLVRVVSEPFALPGYARGQYACSQLGYTLLKRKNDQAVFQSGDLLEILSPPAQQLDEKSGAIILHSY